MVAVAMTKVAAATPLSKVRLLSGTFLKTLYNFVAKKPLFALASPKELMTIECQLGACPVQ